MRTYNDRLIELASKIVKLVEKETLTTPEAHHALELASNYILEKNGFHLVTTTGIKPKRGFGF